MLFGEAKKVYQAMQRTEKKFYATNPLCRVRRDRIVRKFAALNDKFEQLMNRPGITTHVR